MADYYESKFTGAEIDSMLESVPDKIDKVQNATVGNIATLKEDGRIEDSGQKLSDFAKVEDLQNKADLGADGKVPESQLPDMDYASSTHASQHASGGSDPITPESIGAAPAYTYGTEDLTAGTSPLETGRLHFVYE